MLIAVSGSQGCGKSTIINALANAGYPVVSRKTSRSILDDWKVSLSQVNNDHELTIKFQTEIMSRKYQDELSANLSPDIWFTERTFADLFTYSLVSLGKDNEYSPWLDKYYDDCKTLQQSYAAVYYIRAGAFAIENDGVRAANKHYSRMVDLSMWDITQNMTAPNKLAQVNSPHIDERVIEILSTMNRITNGEIQ